MGFKNSVARKHELGNFAITGKRGSRPSTSSAVGVGLGAAKSVKTEPAGGGEPSAAAAVAASASSSGLSSSLQFMLNHNHSAAAAALPAEDDTAPATGRGGGGGRGGAGESAAPAVVPEYTQQSCPLTAPRTSQVVLLEDDLAATLVRSTASGGRALPGGVLSTIRPTGTCLYKWKMGFYSNTNL